MKMAADETRRKSKASKLIRNRGNNPIKARITGLLLCLVAVLGIAVSACSQGQTISSSIPLTTSSVHISDRIPATTIAGNQLLVDGLVVTPLDLNYEDVLRYPTVTQTAILFCAGVYENEPSRNWLGVPVELILKDAGLVPGATKLIFHATDGYTVIQSIDRIILSGAILAYKVDGLTLSPEDGYPFRLISDVMAGGDWIRGVNRIEVA
jgi:DMSO/TMAO reductase YedYZ molybdopterin-dependent catalytic subunit